MHHAKRDALVYMPHFVYILKSLKDKSYYIGQTKNIQARLIKHNTGQSRFTKKKLPYKIIYVKSYKTRKEAIKREKEIKLYKGGNEFKKLIGLI